MADMTKKSVHFSAKNRTKQPRKTIPAERQNDSGRIADDCGRIDGQNWQNRRPILPVLFWLYNHLAFSDLQNRFSVIPSKAANGKTEQSAPRSRADALPTDFDE